MDQTCIKLQWLRIWVDKIGIFDFKTWNFIDVMDNGFKKSDISWPSVTRWAVAILVVTPVLEKGIEIWTGWTWSENTRSIYTKTGTWDWCDDSSLPDRTVDTRRVCASQSAQTKKLWIWFDMRKRKCTVEGFVHWPFHPPWCLLILLFSCSCWPQESSVREGSEELSFGWWHSAQAWPDPLREMAQVHPPSATETNHADASEG